MRPSHVREHAVWLHNNKMSLSNIYACHIKIQQMVKTARNRQIFQQRFERNTSSWTAEFNTCLAIINNLQFSVQFCTSTLNCHHLQISTVHIHCRCSTQIYSSRSHRGLQVNTYNNTNTRSQQLYSSPTWSRYSTSRYILSRCWIKTSVPIKSTVSKLVCWKNY